MLFIEGLKYISKCCKHTCFPSLSSCCRIMKTLHGLDKHITVVAKTRAKNWMLNEKSYVAKTKSNDMCNVILHCSFYRKR